MANNQLLAGKEAKDRKVTVEMLHDLATDLNKKPFVQGMGRFYRVGRESDNDGGFRHFLTWDNVRVD